MLKSTTLFSYEVDNPEKALQEILDQLNTKISLMKNSVGIILCSPEFIKTEALQTISNGLPFPTAGCTTASQGVNGEVGELMLTIMVLTSDDISFAVNTVEFDNDGLAATKSAYESAAKSLGNNPDLIFVFPSLMENKFPGDYFIEIFESVCGTTPIFGGLAMDDTITYETCYSICNGEASLKAMSLIYLSGNINPRFIIGTVSDKYVLPYTGEITKAAGNVVYEINNMRAYDYFDNIGLVKDGQFNKGMRFVPFLLDIKEGKGYDGVSVARSVIGFDENGYAIGRGDMFEHSIFKIGSCNKDDVLSTVLQVMDKINKFENVNAAIMFSCIARRIALGHEHFEEINTVDQNINPQFQYMVGYAGGEICPTSFKDGAAVNRFHNYTLVACIL